MQHGERLVPVGVDREQWALAAHGGLGTEREACPRGELAQSRNAWIAPHVGRDSFGKVGGEGKASRDGRFGIGGDEQLSRWSEDSEGLGKERGDVPQEMNEIHAERQLEGAPLERKMLGVRDHRREGRLPLARGLQHGGRRIDQGERAWPRHVQRDAVVPSAGTDLEHGCRLGRRAPGDKFSNDRLVGPPVPGVRRCKLRVVHDHDAPRIRALIQG